MKVAVLLSSISRLGGGVSEVARQLVLQLSSTAHFEVEVVCLRDGHTSESLNDWPRVPIHVCDVKGPTSFGYAPDLLRTLRMVQPDIVHTHGLWMYPSVASLKFAVEGRPIVISSHGMLDAWALRNSRWKKRIALALFERTHLQRAACLHALCKSELDAIRAFGLRNPACIVPNGIDLPSATDTAVAPHSVLDRQPGQRVLLHLGRIHQKKGLGELIDAWHLVQQSSQSKSDDWVIRIVGWADHPEYQRKLEAKADALGLSGRLKFLGPMYGDKKAAALSGADAFILASQSEGLPMAVLEAWAYGLPVLMTQECNLAEGFAAGAAMPINLDVRALAQELNQFFRMTDAERKEMGHRGRALVSNSYTWQIANDRMQAVYQWLAGRRSIPEFVNTCGPC